MRRQAGAGFGILLLAGCASIFGFDELSDQIDQNVADAADRVDAEPDAGPAPDVADLYVSPSGDDAADGSRLRPLRSLATAALRARARVETTGARVRIAACAGAYPERAVGLRGAVELRGNYDCSTWARPDLFDDVVGPTFESQSVVTDVEPGFALVEIEQDASGAPLLDGFTLSSTQSLSVVIGSGEVRLRELIVTNSTPPQVEYQNLITGISVIGGASIADAGPVAGATVEHCRVAVSVPDEPEGAAVAVALLASEGPHVLQHNQFSAIGVRGGCRGVVIADGSGTVLENEIFLINCVTSEPDAFAATGMFVYQAQVVSTRNSVLMDNPGNRTTRTAVRGFHAPTGGSFTSDGDRVIGPATRAAGSFGTQLRFVGFEGDDSIRSIVNASVVLRLIDDSKLVDSAGIQLITRSTAQLAHNSFYIEGGNDPAADPPFHVIDFSAAALANPSPSALSMESNLAVLAESSFGMVAGSCETSHFTRIAGTRYAGTAPWVSGPGCEADAGLERLTLPDAATDNVELICNGGCARLFNLDGTSLRSHGLTLSDAGCAALELVVPTSSAVASDGTGATRGDTVTRAGASDPCR